MVGITSLRWIYTAMSRAKTHLGLVSDLCATAWLQTLEQLPPSRPDSRLYTWSRHVATSRTIAPDTTW